MFDKKCMTKRRELAGGRSYEGTREPYVQGVLIRMALAPPLFPPFWASFVLWVVLQVRKGSLAVEKRTAIADRPRCRRRLEGSPA